MSTTGQPVATWVIGAGGLLGTALTDTLRRRGQGLLAGTPIAWTRSAAPTLAELLDRFASGLAAGRPWRIAWCAGAGVVGTSGPALAQEVATLTGFLDDLAARRLQPGRFFLASSAGGLYAGTGGGGPFDERSAVAPISDYGRAKLACESAARRFAAVSGHQVVIGRIANLYGPNQDLGKGQGLVSHLCRGYLTRQPTSIYVPLDTTRDYLFVDDCAAMIADMLSTDPPPQAAGDRTVVKVLASQQGTTIATLIGLCRQVFKRRPQLVLGTSAGAKFQVRDLRLRSVCWTAMDRRALTPLPVGIAATAAGMLRAAQTAAS